MSMPGFIGLRLWQSGSGMMRHRFQTRISHQSPDLYPGKNIWDVLEKLGSVAWLSRHLYRCCWKMNATLDWNRSWHYRSSNVTTHVSDAKGGLTKHYCGTHFFCVYIQNQQGWPKVMMVVNGAYCVCTMQWVLRKYHLILYNWCIKVSQINQKTHQKHYETGQQSQRTTIHLNLGLLKIFYEDDVKVKSNKPKQNETNSQICFF